MVDFKDIAKRFKKGVNWFVTGENKEEEDIQQLMKESQVSEYTEQDKKKIIFALDKRPTMQELPDTENLQKVDVRYPLIPPYAYAHIYWNDESNELIYELEEPPLDEVEKNLLRLIQLGLEEMINVSFIRAKKSNLIMQYLERNVQAILVEVGAKIAENSYRKLMYYVYRDAVGMNEIEPLLNDYFIEDIECNGENFPLYIVHRKYQNLKTNITFTSIKRLTDFVEKLAQKAGRYVSYARPLLDGTLPDGSRINATYTGDITTRGPTFTIRKFTKEPWTPVHLIKMQTATAEVFAFLWIAIEYKFNVMIIGETASGKTTFLNTILHFVPPEARICSIEDTREINVTHDNWLPAVTRSGFGIPNLAGVQYGEVDLFDLLRETFRQNPDYVVVGEVRGKETYVLFQGMASGHPSFSTFHAASVEALTRRLETAPISLPSSLVESLDIVCVIGHVKGKSKNVRRVIEIDEIKEVKPGIGRVESNRLFIWDPIKDVIKFNGHSFVFEKIQKRTGTPISILEEEFKKRTILINKMVQKDMLDMKNVAEILNTYIKNPAVLPAEFRSGGIVKDVSAPLNKNKMVNKKITNENRTEENRTDKNNNIENRTEENNTKKNNTEKNNTKKNNIESINKEKINPKSQFTAENKIKKVFVIKSDNPPADKIKDKLVSKPQNKPVNKPENKPVNKPENKPVNKINTKPTSRVDTKPVSMIENKPSNKFDNDAINKIRENMNAKKGSKR